jgi:hypothetical protein
MARAIEDIRTSIKGNVTTVFKARTGKDLTIADGAMWMQFVESFAESFFAIELIVVVHLKTVEDIVLTKIHGDVEWLREQVLKFQFGHTLLRYDDGTYGYAINDDAAKIVKRCVISEEFDELDNVVVHIKVMAASDAVLSAYELNSLRTYINRVKYAGTNVIVTSYVAATLDLGGTFYYGNGYSESETLAIAAYLFADSATMFFFAPIYNAIASAKGVVDARISSMVINTIDPVTSVSVAYNLYEWTEPVQLPTAVCKYAQAGETITLIAV